MTELYHHGIKGQRWGIRRYQNEDGSVTAAGAQRYYENPSNARQNFHFKSKVSSASSSAKKAVSSKLASIDKEKLKKAAKIGAAVVGTAAVAYGAYKLNSLLNDQAAQNIIAKGHDRIEQLGSVENTLRSTAATANRRKRRDIERILTDFKSKNTSQIIDETKRELDESKRSLGKKIKNAREWSKQSKAYKDKHRNTYINYRSL